MAETSRKIAISTAAGSSIDYNTVLEGPQNAPVVVLAHALMADLRMWNSTAKALNGAGYRTLRFDYIGHGGTSVPASFSKSTSGEIRLHFDEITKHIRELVLQSTGEEHIHAIIGCSMGGVLALRFAMLYPSMVARVVSCDAPGLTSLRVAKPLWQERVAEFRKDGSEELTRKTVDRWFPDPCNADIKKAALEQTRSVTVEGYAICVEGIQNYDYDEELTDVKVRTLVLAGENDGSIGPPETLQEVARKIEGAEYVQVKDCGHLPPMHQPEEFEKVMLNFLKD